MGDDAWRDGLENSGPEVGGIMWQGKNNSIIHLTERQTEVVNLRLEGKTQIQIADELGVHQTTVHKLLMGNIDYANGKKRYGGAIKKLKKICENDETINKILKKIKNLKIEEKEN